VSKSTGRITAVAIVIWGILFNTQTHTQTDGQLLNSYMLSAQRAEVFTGELSSENNNVIITILIDL